MKYLTPNFIPMQNYSHKFYYTNIICPFIYMDTCKKFGFLQKEIPRPLKPKVLELLCYIYQIYLL